MTAERRERLVVTGGSGFIGRNLITELDKDRYETISISRSSEVDGVRNVHEDLTRSDFGFLESLNPDFVVYLATISSPKEAALKKQESFDTNVTTIQKFLEKAKDLKIKKIILLSSVVLYAGDKEQPYKEEDEINPFRDAYNLSKFFLEGLANYYGQNYGLTITVFRLSNTYGPHQTTEKVPLLIPKLFGQALSEGKIEVWNQKPVRDWVYVRDICKVIVRELEISGGGVFNLGTGEGRSVGEVVEIISQLTGVSRSNLDKHVEPPFKVVCDVRKLRKHSGFVPDTTLEQGLRQTYEYYKNLKKI